MSSRWSPAQIERDPGLAPSGHVVTCPAGHEESLTVKQAAGQRSLCCSTCGDLFRFTLDVEHAPSTASSCPTPGLSWLQSTWMPSCRCLWRGRVHAEKADALAELAAHLEKAGG